MSFFYLLLFIPYRDSNKGVLVHCVFNGDLCPLQGKVSVEEEVEGEGGTCTCTAVV